MYVAGVCFRSNVDELTTSGGGTGRGEYMVLACDLKRIKEYQILFT